MYFKKRTKLKTKHKIIIDSLIGTLLAYCVNFTARALGFLLNINHSLDRSFTTIVISKYAGLGSIIQATPLIQTLRKNYPKAKIIFITTSGNATLIKHIPEIDELILVSDKTIWSIIATSTKLILQLWRIKPDLYFDLEFYSNYSGIMTTLSKATNRFGFYNPEKAYRKGIYNYLVPFSVDVPISDTYLQFADLLKCDLKISKLKIQVLSPDSEFKNKINLAEEEKYIVVNPNASDLRLERRWPKKSFADVLTFLLTHYSSHRIILIGNKTEAHYVNELVASLEKDPNLIDSSGKLTLTELISLIAGADLMLTNDTGPMHIAFALNVKTISLFGPCSPTQYGTIENGITFYKKVDCSPCVHSFLIPPCKGNNICMKNISVTEVKEALKESLI